MSRIPQPSSSRPSLKPPSTPGKSRIATASSPVRTRMQSTRSATPTKTKIVDREQDPVARDTPTLSIKEAIALKRAQAKNAQKAGGGGGLDNLEGLEDALPENKPEEEEDLLGRLSVRDSIEQARSTGSLNLATRLLPCLPSALFEIHLGLTPNPLKSVPNEPVLPPSESKPGRLRGDKPAWFEAQDLTVLKAWDNAIQEIQHELSLFGSLKTIDLHKNKLMSLPNSFADLTSLTVLDLSHNALTSIPDKIFALPELTTLNLSHNLLTGLPFNAPFTDSNGRTRANQQSSGGFFTPVVTHSTTPLPRLLILDTSYNKIVANAINDSIPVSLTKFDLSGNPLGSSQKLLRSLSSLKRLKELKFEKSELGDDSFPSDAFPPTPFVALRLLNLSETQVSLGVAKDALKEMKQELNFDFSTEDPPEGVTRVLVGKQILKEPWELELERRAKARVAATSPFGDDWSEPAPVQRSTPTPTGRSSAAALKPPPASPVKPKPVVKEAWEIEAEQGLLTEGGKRRARAAAAAAQAQAAAEGPSQASSSAQDSSPPTNTSPSSTGPGLSNPQYFTQNTQTLRLPASAAPTKSAGHGRAFSMAAPSSSSFSSGLSSRNGDLVVPTPTLPLAAIVAQPFSQSLRVLILANRRMDRSFSLPAFSDSLSGFLPNLEELDLEGCNLTDLVQVSQASDAGSGANTPPRSNELVIPTLAKLFPSLRTLNLSYNALTNASLAPEALSNLVLTSPHRKGLRHLRLRGNRISELDGFLGLAEAFKGNREVPGWKLEELDLRDNEIGRLPPELGLLPLDVFLVDGNTFRVPQRRVWEREGTKGLLSWLRGRIE
ncbi:hypothetical protein GALMADRAFT_229699 [Galerina marginata CBS 339.88]|uniref:L domain-like protein n=1 Tax=Galerina marginata (strain CBS 339.88) TaxID=685588 RepID=A0A067SLZ1_GALM3|nr:hypothetical protein GALMADRAFT_229699 [Galerina marginata CBS 339.88]